VEPHSQLKICLIHTCIARAFLAPDHRSSNIDSVFIFSFCLELSRSLCGCCIISAGVFGLIFSRLLWLMILYFSSSISDDYCYWHLHRWIDSKKHTGFEQAWVWVAGCPIFRSLIDILYLDIFCPPLFGLYVCNWGKKPASSAGANKKLVRHLT
jgi:hypothetical protein